MTSSQYFYNPNNKQVHILLEKKQQKQLPPGSIQLLGLGLNFCLKKPKPTNKIETTIMRFKKDIRREYTFRNVPDSEGNYIKQLYIANKHWQPNYASDTIENALDNFEARLKQEHAKFQRKSLPNITPLQKQALNKLIKHPKFIVLQADKNMGVCVLDRENFIKQALQEHLDDKKPYQILTAAQASAKQAHIRYLYHNFVNKHKNILGDEVCTFMLRGYREFGDKIAQFRTTVKIHKNPWKLRPIVAKCGTILECVSKWLDFKLQKLVELMPAVVKDSQTFRDELVSLDLPKNARIFTSDAVSMYTNIDLNHAMQVMQDWMDTLPKTFQDYEFNRQSQNAILEGLNLIMRNNLMQFGDTYFLQDVGTTMGTSVAVIFANLHHGWHEKTCILPRYKTHEDPPLLFYKRFIDDIFGIWVGTDQQFDNLVEDANNFGIMKWDFNKPTTTVNFLDLSITVKEGKITTRTHQKEGNPYLYITPHSAHPPGMIKGVIFVFGLVRRYYEQNSDKKDFIDFTKMLFKRLVTRGWDPTYIKPIFHKAIQNTQSETKTQDQLNLQNSSPRKRNQLFLHFNYHPSDIPRCTIRKLYEEELKDTLIQE